MYILIFHFLSGQKGLLNLCNLLCVRHAYSVQYCNEDGSILRWENNYNLLYYVIILNLSFASLHKTPFYFLLHGSHCFSVCAFRGSLSRIFPYRFTVSEGTFICLTYFFHL